ncbi:hypothetical protein CAter10_2621 [Collimonas arenae]|nr:hypothetical protein CAter10_2621 [Collimonas arenae]
MESNLKAVNNDVKALLRDSQALFQAAAALTGDKAEEMRSRAMLLLDTALTKAREAQADAVVAGKEMVGSAEDYMTENPWCTIAAAAGVGFFLGMALSRR